jgi:hypothetical protein
MVLILSALSLMMNVHFRCLRHIQTPHQMLL